MKKLILMLLSAVVISSCQSSQGTIKDYKENPCEDILYLKLKKMKVSEMTGTESEYFRKKDKECKEFSEDVKTKKTDHDFLIVIAVLAIAAAVVVPFLLSLKMH